MCRYFDGYLTNNVFCLFLEFLENKKIYKKYRNNMTKKITELNPNEWICGVIKSKNKFWKNIDTDWKNILMSKNN
jgi:hypothetical protein